MKAKSGLLAAVALGVMLAACASTGTRVSTASDGYKDMARSQQWWCGTSKDNCTCSIDGVQTTCSLVYACMNSGNCKAAQ